MKQIPCSPGDEWLHPIQNLSSDSDVILMLARHGFKVNRALTVFWYIKSVFWRLLLMKDIRS